MGQRAALCSVIPASSSVFLSHRKIKIVAGHTVNAARVVTALREYVASQGTRVGFQECTILDSPGSS